MKAYRVYTDERSDSMFSDTLITEVVVLAEDEAEALKTVLKRYGNNLYFVCNDSDLKVEEVKELILSVSYNS